ncbi:Phosphomethylethanolamine N-methyltransferase [Chaetomidium leptoderma]|uniref:Phosphomethylethanolamine N-methyltransferase n=1 Tax=Chaetomidium leptoderma TaxID=669021 RepID=A0AAN6VL03_9PEZI|nr:Phosphomethylethanolamine N-methyltransferase [Chaetomidium leptoderma]
MGSPRGPSSPEAATSPGAAPSSPPRAAPSPKGGPSSPQAAASPKAAVSPGKEETDQPSTAHILPAEHWTEQPLDDDLDSTLGDSDAASSTASLSTSILEYRTLHGRTFHSDRVTDAQYWTPNDERQMEASDIIHHCLTLVHDGALFKAPLKDDLEVSVWRGVTRDMLTLKSITGIWAIDFADKYPNTQVTGTDISPIQPTWVPPNLKFEMDDATLDWTYADDHFDYVHMRYLFGSVADWPALLQRAYRCCKPGGHVESFEASCVFRSDDGSLADGTPMDQWGKVFVEAGKKFGRPFDVVGEGLVQDAFEKAGFEAITQWEFKCPIGAWPQDKKLRDIGSYALAGILQDIEGWILFVWSQVMGWSKEQVAVYVAHLRNQLKDRNVHGYVMMRSVYGRKPKTAAV